MIVSWVYWVKFIKIAFICCCFSKVTTRKFKITHVAHIMFPWTSAVLENSPVAPSLGKKLQKSRYHVSPLLCTKPLGPVPRRWMSVRAGFRVFQCLG